MRRRDAGRRIFVRYAVNNFLILSLPLLIAVAYYHISLRVIRRDVDTITVSQLERSMSAIDRLLEDTQRVFVQLANEYDVNAYLNAASFTGIEQYNMKRISQRLSSYVLGNDLVSHCLLYLDKSGYVIYESGFAPYESFYGPLFTSEGQTAAQWREAVLRSPGGERFTPRQVVTMGGQRTQSCFYRRPIGYGSYYLGAIVGIIDQEALARLLADLPRRYGGRVTITDAQGGLIALTGEDAGDGADAQRRYQMTSGFNGWVYTAWLSERSLLADVRAVRNTAFALLGFGLAAGIAASYLFAFTNSRPLRRLFDLVLGEQARGRSVSVYEQVEQALLMMSSSKKQLESEVRSSRRIARTAFFQNLLRGVYRSREAFAGEARASAIEFDSGSYYVILCRLAPLGAADEGQSYVLVRDALALAVENATGAGDFFVPVSFDDLAIVRRLGLPWREDALTVVEAVRAGVDPKLRPDFVFGVGAPASDPYLLVISHNQAAAAASSAAAAACVFCEDVPEARAPYYYPLEIEENIIKAVRSCSADLLDSLLAAVRRENFEGRRLAGVDARDLFVELQGTVLRLLADLRERGREARPQLERWSARPPGPEKLEALRQLFLGVARLYDTGKKSHNSALLESVRKLVSDAYPRPDLGLTVIADTLGISPNYLSNFFKEQTGERLSAAIMRTRLEEAMRLLRDGDAPIDAIAGRCGYVNASSFRRAFKRASGLSPSQYRGRHVGSPRARGAGAPGGG